MSFSSVQRVVALRTRTSRRIAVVIVLAITALLGSSLPSSLHGLGIVVVLVLVAIDAVLVSVTGGLAFARRPLDERESALRDFAYRRGFRLLGLALAVALLLFIAGSYVSYALVARSPNGPSYPELNNVVTGRGLIAMLELLVMLPTLMLAWTSIGDMDVDGARPRHWSLRNAGLTLLAVTGAWLLVVALVPEQTVGAGSNANSSSGDGPPGATCMHVVAGRMVGVEFGATAAMRVEACWNGTVAFVWGDPTIPPPSSVAAAMNVPPGAPAYVVNPDLPYLTSCTADTVDDFESVSQTCSASVDAAGTLHYTVRAHVALPGGIGARDLALVLVVTRDGRVLALP
jgi:hypothetical protein